MKKQISTVLLFILSLGHAFCALASQQQPQAKRHRPAPAFSISQSRLAQATSVAHITQLIQMGADFYQKDPAGDTVLHKAIKNKNAQAIEALLCYARGISDKTHDAYHLLVQPNTQGLLPLHLAAQQGFIPALQHIFTHYPEINCNYALESGPYKDCTPLDLACMFAQQDAVEYLLHQDNIIVDTRLLFKKVPENYTTPLYHACTQQPFELTYKTHKQRAAIAESILECYPESLTIHCGPLNDTPLHRASQHGNKELTALLLTKNAHIASLDNQGSTPYERLQKTPINQNDKYFIAKLFYILGHACSIEENMLTPEDKFLHAIAQQDTAYVKNYKPQNILPTFTSIVYILTTLQDSLHHGNMLKTVLELPDLPIKQDTTFIRNTFSSKTRFELVHCFVHTFNQYLQKARMLALPQTLTKDIIIEFET